MLKATYVAAITTRVKGELMPFVGFHTPAVKVSDMVSKCIESEQGQV